MSKSDLLKDSMKGGLDGLLSPTKKTTGGKQPVAPTERNGGSLQLRHQQKHSYPYEIPRHQEEHVAERHRERGNERVSGRTNNKHRHGYRVCHPETAAMRPFLSARCFHRAHSSFIVLPSFSFLPARKYRHMARFIPILTLTGISLFYRFPYRFPGFILCRHRCVLSDARSAVALDTAA